MTTTLNQLASTFLGLFDNCHLSDQDATVDSLTVEQAYAVQQRVIEARTHRGERVVGYKVGCTSPAIRQQFGLDEPICGRVLAPHVHHHNATVDCRQLFQPAVEPEFVIRMGEDLDRELAADEPITQFIETVAPGIEVHNYHFWLGPPSLQELIASNGIHACLIMGTEQKIPSGYDWNLEQVSLIKNTTPAAVGTGGQIMGGPLKSLRWLVNHLVQQGQSIQAGDIVIPGSPVELISVQTGDSVTAHFSGLGEVTARFVDATH